MSEELVKVHVLDSELLYNSAMSYIQISPHLNINNDI